MNLPSHRWLLTREKPRRKRKTKLTAKKLLFFQYDPRFPFILINIYLINMQKYLMESIHNFFSHINKLLMFIKNLSKITESDESENWRRNRTRHK
jgi:hypothetical protein